MVLRGKRDRAQGVVVLGPWVARVCDKEGDKVVQKRKDLGVE